MREEKGTADTTALGGRAVVMTAWTAKQQNHLFYP